MSSTKGTGRVTDKVTRLRSRGKRALQIYIRKHFDLTGETLAEWDAWERIIQDCVPDLWKEAVEMEQRLGNGDEE